MEISQKNTTRWQRLTHGYNKYWYCKAALRWLALVTAVVTLITFGATWRDYTLYSQYDVGYVYESLAITCPLIAVIVDVFAIVLLFRTRKNSNINPVFLLAGDTLTLPLLIIDMAITCPGEFGFHVSTASVEFPLVMVWGLTVGLTALHLILFITSIWETHIFRAMRREQKMSGSVNLQDLKHRSQDLESDTSTISSVTEGPIRVELPDGRIFELPEGTRFELSAEQRSEWPAQLPGVFLAELEAPVPTRRVDEKFDQGPITTARSVVDNLLAIHSRDGP
ncbi:hypothetical protein D6D24_06517 [Aureobasidium pullulans]|uniref:Uncharacterized protein n=1 Tax=Aureobasidium pullulans TaxID=5580 RepID=A0A4S8VKP2_AURPU|nr:hypothetical protein D6D24_06517 [Aureobasidium pullulans]